MTKVAYLVEQMAPYWAEKKAETKAVGKALLMAVKRVETKAILSAVKRVGESVEMKAVV